MKKKSTKTPRGRIRSCIRNLWLRSRERATALKDAGYCCKECGVKKSAAKGKEIKLEVHHSPPIGKKWDHIIDLIVKDILESPQFPLCKECHSTLHKKNIKINKKGE